MALGSRSPFLRIRRFGGELFFAELFATVFRDSPHFHSTFLVAWAARVSYKYCPGRERQASSALLRFSFFFFVSFHGYPAFLCRSSAVNERRSDDRNRKRDLVKNMNPKKKHIKEAAPGYYLLHFRPKTRTDPLTLITL